MKKILNLTVKLFFILLVASQLQAVVPQKWELRTKEDFIKGKFSGVSLSSGGWLSIGPRVEKIEVPVEEFYLSIAVSPEGSIYLGTGHGGKIYRIGTDKKAELYFQTAEMDVTSLAVDQKGNLFAGTSPNGKIYKITEKGKADEFFNPQEKYIWDLRFEENGNLLVAVGEGGGIYEVTPAGEGKIIFKPKANHILCLRKGPSGEILAGSSNPGLIYRLSSNWKPSVVYESTYEEIKNIAFDQEGNVYASVSGQVAKPASEAAPISLPPVKLDSATDISVVVSAPQVSPSETIQTLAPRTGAKPSAPISSAIFQITPDGLARQLWSSSEEMVFGLIYDEDGKKVIFGTGNQGRIYSVDRDGQTELLTQEGSEQIYGLYKIAKKIYLLGNNPCFMGLLPLGQNLSGEYLSPVLDAKIISSWGRVEWEAKVPQGGLVQIQSRSGNSAEPDETWSDWSPPYSGTSEKILSPKGRFLQLKVNLKSQAGSKLPEVTRLLVFYLQTNVAPVIEKLEILPPNQVFIKPPEQEEVIMGLDKSSQESSKRKDETSIFLTPKRAERQGFRTITWDATDGNEDKLSYSVFIRKEEDQNWRLMQDNITEKVFSSDTRNFPDGTYFLKLVASDLPSNPTGTDKKAEKTSRPLVIDNTPPVVKNFSALRTKDGLEISFVAEDNYSYIEEAKVLIKPNDWQVVFPVDGICDSRTENFHLTLKLPPQAENLILIKVRDSFGNVGVFQSQY
ncbi:MAG TPA: hypothetical protein ENO29_04940 [Candidatus Aminicenantes bacterium]|nr:hypothetical protein [Candidatus Aminicenantes bacterium]